MTPSKSFHGKGLAELIDSEEFVAEKNPSWTATNENWTVQYAKPEDFVTFPDTHLTDEAIAIIDKAVATAAAELGTHMAEWLGKAALTPRQLLLLNPDKVFPPDQWCYEVQYRIMTGRPFNDGWSDWQAIPRYPSRFSTPRRAANRQRKVANDRGFIPTQYRIEPVFLGRVPDFKWERSQRNKPKNVTLTDHETRKRTAMRTATGSNLLLGGSYHIGEQKTK